jgi:hypothetical protein
VDASAEGVVVRSLELHHALIPHDHAPIDRLFEVTALSRDFRVGQLAYEGGFELAVVFEEVEDVGCEQRRMEEVWFVTRVRRARGAFEAGQSNGFRRLVTRVARCFANVGPQRAEAMSTRLVARRSQLAASARAMSTSSPDAHD